MNPTRALVGLAKSKLLFLTVSILLLGKISVASAVIYDLTSDWSNINNPNGVWSLNEGSNPLPFVQDYVPGTTGTSAVWTTGHNAFFGLTGDQNAWAAKPFPQTGHVPVFLKSDAAFADWPGISDIQAGDVVVHGKCCSNLPGTGEANVTWTSGINGMAAIAGNIWWGTTTTNRNVDWNIYINNVLVTGGNVSGTDIYDRANPFLFSTGSGGAGVLSFNTVVGDIVKLELKKGPNSPFDHFVGINFSVAVTSVPEPVTLGLISLGLLCLCYRRRFERDSL